MASSQVLQPLRPEERPAMAPHSSRPGRSFQFEYWVQRAPAGSCNSNRNPTLKRDRLAESAQSRKPKYKLPTRRYDLDLSGDRPPFERTHDEPGLVLLHSGVHFLASDGGCTKREKVLRHRGGA